MSYTTLITCTCMHFNCLSNFAVGLKLITFVVFLFRGIEHYKSVQSEKMDIGFCASDDNPGIQIWTCLTSAHFSELTASSSPRWRRSSVVAILTEMIKSLLLWTSFWRSKMPTSTKTRSICSTNVGLKCVNVENGCVDSVAMQHFTNTIPSHVTFVISCRLEFICYLRAF